MFFNTYFLYEKEKVFFNEHFAILLLGHLYFQLFAETGRRSLLCSNEGFLSSVEITFFNYYYNLSYVSKKLSNSTLISSSFSR